MYSSPELTADEEEALAGASTRRTYLAAVPSPVVATARINGNLAFPLMDIPTTSESAGWTDVKKDMAVLIGSGAGLADRAIFRVRQDVTGTGSIAVGEFGTNDSGIISLSDLGLIGNGNYITVIDRYDLHSVHPRIDYAGGTTGNIYEDGERTDTTANLLPSPVVRISTNNSRGGHFGIKVLDDKTVPITAVATVEQWPSSNAILSYQWTYPVSFTEVSGATTATLTATAPVGNHKITCTVTPNLGAPFTATRWIIINDDTTNPAILIASVDSDSRDRKTRRSSISLNNTRIASIPNGAMCIQYDMCTWNGEDVPTATTTFVGWIVQYGAKGERGLRDASPELIGVGAVLEMITNTSQLFEVTNIPASWQQMGYQLAVYNWCIWWLLTYRVSNILRLFNFYPYSTSATVGRQPAFEVGGGTLLSQVQALASRYRKGNFGTSSGGEMFVAVHPAMIAPANRVSLPRRATITASKYLSVNYRRDLRPRVRQTEGEAFTWDGVAASPTALKSVTPEKPSQGNADETLDSQIVASQAELNEIAGLYYGWLNNPILSVTVVIPCNYDVIEPAELPLITIVIPDYLSPTGTEWEFDGVPISVSKRYLSDGATDIELTIEPLTSAAAGKTVPVPPPGTAIDPSLPPIEDVFPSEIPVDWGPELPIDPEEELPLDPQPDAPDEYPDIYLGTQDGHAAKVTNGSLTDISPHVGFRTLLGTTFQLAQDAGNYSVGYMVGANAILRANSITGNTPNWQAVVALTIIPTDPGDYDFTVGDEYGWEPYLGYQANWLGAGWESVFIVDRDYLNLEKQFSEMVNLTSIRIVGNNTSSNFIYVIFDIFTGGAWTTTSATTWPSLGLGPFDVTYDVSASYLNADATALRVFLISHGTYGAPDPFTLDHIELTADAFPIIPYTDERIIGAFTCYENKANAYCWLSKKTIDGTLSVLFNRTLDNFATHQQIPVARYVTDMAYSIAVNKHNWRFVHVTAGDPAEGDAYVYKSVDGGGSFAQTDVELFIHGGQLFTNWSTGTPNTPNITSANLIIVRGLDGSDDL